jgi:hypothetical protein
MTSKLTEENFYRVEECPIGFCVVDERGFNCLSFPEAPGAKFTTKEHAQEICDLWNSKG